VALGVLVGIGIAPGVWPYSHGCGLRLVFYLVGVTTVIAAGLWASISSWKRRLGFAHVVAQILIVWGILLMTREVLRASAPGPQPCGCARRAAAALTPVTRHLKPPMPENFKNFIAGEWVAPRTGAYFENRNPRTGTT